MPETAGNPFGGLDLLSSSVVLLDDGLAIRYLNPAAENLLEISNRLFTGCRLDRVMDCPPKLLAAVPARSAARATTRRAHPSP